MRIRSVITLTAFAAATALALTACSGGGGDPLSADAPAKPADGIIVGSADFPESQLLATLYAQALDAAGIDATTKLNIGSREVYIPALLDGSINLLPEYSGATLSYLNKDSEATAPDEVNTALGEALPDGARRDPCNSRRVLVEDDRGPRRPRGRPGSRRPAGVEDTP
jgi:osmoprotectant transport system substrate-binding protein